MYVSSYIKTERKKNSLRQIGGFKGPKPKGTKMSKLELKRRRNLQLIAKGGVFTSDSRANVVRQMQRHGFENA